MNHKAKRIFDELIVNACISSTPLKVGILIKKLSKEKREILKQLTSNDIQDRIS